MTGAVDCREYKPGPVMGKTRPVCIYYIPAPPDAAGGCTRPDHFMCEYWLDAQNKKNSK